MTNKLFWSVAFVLLYLLTFAGIKTYYSYHHDKELAEQIHLVKITKLEQLWVASYKGKAHACNSKQKRN